MTREFDVIVVGGGHNGLVCASYLAKAGRTVLLLEAADTLGGAAATREFSKGYSVSSCAHWLYQLNPQVNTDLSLQRHGLQLAARDLTSIVLAEDGKHVSFKGGTVGGSDVSARDKTNFNAFHEKILRYTKVLANAFARRPPKLVESDWRDKLSLLKLGIDMKRLGREEMGDLLRVGLMNIYDLLNENFDNELLKAGLSLDAVMGTHMGPRSPNTVLSYLYRRLGDVYGYNGPAVVQGGMGALGATLVHAARAFGVEIRSGSKVAKINLTADLATGVTLADGEVINAKTIVSNADPKTTFYKLVGVRNIEAGFARRIHTIRMRGNAAKLHLALDGLPEFTGLAVTDAGNRLLIAPTMAYIERAFNHAKYREYSSAPALDISIASVHDSSLAPAGKHVLSAIVQYAPRKLKAGWEDSKDTFKQLVIDRIADYAPAIKEQITASELLTPADLEAEFRISGGHWHHGEISADQLLMMRPVPGASQYATPIDGLYLCGAGAHPGGGVMGLAGRNAAQEIIGATA